MQDKAADRLFKALSDGTRRRLLDRLRADNGQTLGALCQDLGMSRQAISQHLELLEAAGVISTVRRGRDKLHYLNPVPLHEIADRWIATFERADLRALSQIKQQLEKETHAMTTSEKLKAVYVTYIATTQEKLWQALTDPELTLQYWDHRNVSGWTKGSSWEHVRPDGTSDGGGLILEIDPPNRLSHSWAAPNEMDKPDRYSRVTFDLQPQGNAIRLTVTHEDIDPATFADSNEGWAMVLATLKSFLETGKPLRIW